MSHRHLPMEVSLAIQGSLSAIQLGQLGGGSRHHDVGKILDSEFYGALYNPRKLS